MKKFIFYLTTAAFFTATPFLLISCIKEEPQNLECDIISAYVHVDEPSELFYNLGDTLIEEVPTATDSIGFTVKTDCVLGSYPFYITVTPGAVAYLVENDGTSSVFVSGTALDFSDGRKAHLRVVSESGTWEKNYWVSMTHRHKVDGDMTFDFNEGSYFLRKMNKANFYVWEVLDENARKSLFLGDPEWKNGNPGYALSKSSAAPTAYPTSPLFGEGPDGSDCVKLETMTTGSLGAMAKIYIAAGSLFVGSFDPQKAMKSRTAAKEATSFGRPFDHKPLRMYVDLKYLPSSPFCDEDKNPIAGVVDEPDAYVVVYKNTDENGNNIILNGYDVLTSKYIVGMARLPHHLKDEYIPSEGRTIKKDVISGNPIHGVTNEWKRFEMNVEYTEELDYELLKNYGYSMIIGFSCSWQGANFQGALGSKLYIDNIRIECED